MLQFDVATYHIGRYLIPHRSHKVSIAPHFPSPQLLSQLRIPTKHLSRRDTFHHLYHPARAVPRRCHHKQVNMIGHHFHRVYLQLIPLGYPCKDLFQTLGQRLLQNQFAIFRNPYKMVLQVVDRMARSFDRTHPVDSNGRIRLRRISAGYPAARSYGVSSGGTL